MAAGRESGPGSAQNYNSEMVQNPYEAPVAKVTANRRFVPPFWLSALFGVAATGCLVASVACLYASTTTNTTFVSFNGGEFIEFSTFLRNCSLGFIVAAGSSGIAALLCMKWRQYAHSNRES
ncbi:MAG: hypothetical protein KF708_18435 [Pirellulales bacterium]|nr:hypothetical protein [Pirellulales bacterium]